MELSKQELEIYLYPPCLLSKTPFTKCFKFDPRGSKLIFKTGNGIIQTGNGIISLTSKPLIKKLLLKDVSYLIQGVENLFSKQEME